MGASLSRLPIPGTADRRKRPTPPYRRDAVVRPPSLRSGAEGELPGVRVLVGYGLHTVRAIVRTVEQLNEKGNVQ